MKHGINRHLLQCYHQQVVRLACAFHSVIAHSCSHEPSTGLALQHNPSLSEDALCWTSRMPLLLSGANPVDSVMTRRWGRCAKLEGDLTRAHTRLSATTSEIRRLSLPSPLSSESPGKPSSQQFTEFKATRSQSNASIKVCYCC